MAALELIAAPTISDLISVSGDKTCTWLSRTPGPFLLQPRHACRTGTSLFSSFTSIYRSRSGLWLDHSSFSWSTDNLISWKIFWKSVFTPVMESGPDHKISKASPNHDAPTTVLHHWDDILMYSSLWWSVSSLYAKWILNQITWEKK